MDYAIDFENHLIGKKHPYPKPVCLSYATDGNSGLLAGPDMEPFLQYLLKGKGKIIAHNAVFECLVIWAWMPNLRPLIMDALTDGRIICTSITEQYKTNQNKRGPKKHFPGIGQYSLANLVKEYFDEDISGDKKKPDAWRLRYHELEGVAVTDYPQKAYDYAVSDSIYAYKLHKSQAVYWKYTKRQVESAVWLNLMASKGMLVDIERAQELENEIYAKLEPVYARLIKTGILVPGKKKRPSRSNKKLTAHIVSTVKGLRYTEKGGISSDKESLKVYVAETKDPIFKDLLLVNQYDKIITAYTPQLIESNGLIRSQYSTSKSTARTSSFKTNLYPSVSIQQMPRVVEDVKWDVRNCFIPREGYCIVPIDFAGLELCSAAHQLSRMRRNSTLLETINNPNGPVDLHSKLAAVVMSMAKGYKITYEEFVEHKHEAEFKHYRQLCKAINLGFPGGIGYDTMRVILAQDNIYPHYEVLKINGEELVSTKKYVLQPLYSQAKDKIKNLRLHQVAKDKWVLAIDELVGLKQTFLSLYPDLKWFLTEGHRKGLTGQVLNVKNDFGEWEEEPQYCYEFEDFRRDWCNYTAYCNGKLMQTPSAVGATKMCSQIIKKYLNSEDVHPLAFIHDELVFEVKCEGDLKGRVKELCKDMLLGLQSTLSSVRLTVEAQYNMPYWSKSGGEAVSYYVNANSQVMLNNE